MTNAKNRSAKNSKMAQQRKTNVQNMNKAEKKVGLLDKAIMVLGKLIRIVSRVQKLAVLAKRLYDFF